MANLPWCRLYTEFASDPKIQILAFEDQRHFVMLLCLKGNGTLDAKAPNDAYRERLIAKALGLDPITATEVKRRLVDGGLTLDDWQPIAWASRQFKSDHSAAERKRKQRLNDRSRDKNGTVTTMSRDSHNDVSALDSDSESEKTIHGQSDFDLFWSAYPKRVKRKTSLGIWKRKKPDVTALLADLERRKSDRRWIEGYIPDPPTYLNQERWNDEIEPPKERTVVC